VAVGWILNLEDEMSEAKTYEEWTKCTGVFCDLCKKEIAKYEIALRRTSAIACINTNRNYIGFELDKHYCDIANERIRKALADSDEK